MSQPPMCFAEDALINPNLFPVRASDLVTEPVRASAASLRALGQSLSGHTQTISTRWDGLAPVYQAPESGKVLGLMAPALQQAETIDGTFATIAGRLEGFADEVDDVKPLLADLERRAAVFRKKVQYGVETSAYDEAGIIGHIARMPTLGLLELDVVVPWNEHGPSVEKNKALLGEYARLLEQLETASTSAANAISMTHAPALSLFSIAGGPYQATTSDQILASGNLGWGAPVDETRSAQESVSDGMGDFGSGLLWGVTSLAGYHPDTGWSGATAGQTWGGLGNLVGSLAFVTSPLAVAAGAMAPDSAFGQFARDRQDVVGTAVTGLVGYDYAAAMAGQDGWHQWRENPWRAGTNAVLNVGTFFIPAAGAVGAGAKTVGGARTLTVAAGVADAVVPLGSFAVKGTATVLRAGASPVAVGVNTAATGARYGTAGIANAAAKAPDLLGPATIPDNALRPGPHANPSGIAAPGTPRGTGPESLLYDDWTPRTHEPTHADRASGHPIEAPAPAPERELASVGARPGDVTARSDVNATNTITTERPHPRPEGASTTITEPPGTTGTTRPAGPDIPTGPGRGGPHEPPTSPEPTGHAGDPDAPNPDRESGGGEGTHTGEGQNWPPSAKDYPRPDVAQTITVEGPQAPGPRTTFLDSKFVKANGGLEPNTVYHVPGRGDFYTDHTATITYVEATYGGQPLNWDLHKPMPNTTYVVHPNVTHPEPGPSYAHVFVTDSEARTVLAHTDRLSRGDALRSESVQAKTGKEGGDGYDGGHSYGTVFGGGGEYINLTAQLREINQNFPNSFYRIEEHWRALLPDGPGPHPTIEVDIKKAYNPGDLRPIAYAVEYRVDGGKTQRARWRNV
ncbi:DNA/RNA non-specific endonuclease [Oerskovia merdavium]|uniref:DNA/RNA non-specific endonuclease n=1 Tax=Oerskovia merdavium TaxID=2762227 RepID=A0ABR8U4D4_9CELL|nr:DNA/RNA non-specific endonuclease [Oerskovia merdavium]MBD7982892.1 DNA/RNA non-specific endonuclease [Oerskovia merdavium]